MSEQFADVLKEFKEPVKGKRKIPYVLFAKMSKTFKINKDNQYDEVDAVAVHCLDCSNGQGQEGVIGYYVRKGFKILKWSFPFGDDAKDYLGMFGPGNHFVSLDNYCKMMSGLGDERVKDLAAHNNALQAKVDQYEKELKKKGQVNEKQ